MEIGPVNGIRAISLLSVQRSEGVAPPIFEIDASAPAGDETYSSGSQHSQRGLEGEESDSAAEEADGDPEIPSSGARSGAGISFFA